MNLIKWFKHQATANMDAKLQEILLDYGLEGYGLYWYCIELIANDVEPEKLNFELEHDCRVIARNTGSTVQRVQEMMTKFVDVGLFENSTGVITCLKLARVSDDYTAKLIRNNQATGRIDAGVRQSPTKSDKNSLEDSKTEESKTDKSRLNISDGFERFWLAGMTKQSKQKSKQAFEKQFKEACKADKSTTAESFTDYLVCDVQQRLAAQMFGFDKMHPTTYLNQQRWQDDIVKQSPNGMSKTERTFDNLQNMQLADIYNKNPTNKIIGIDDGQSN